MARQMFVNEKKSFETWWKQGCLRFRRAKITAAINGDMEALKELMGVAFMKGKDVYIRDVWRQKKKKELKRRNRQEIERRKELRAIGDLVE